MEDVPFAVITVEADAQNNITLTLSDASRLLLNADHRLRFSDTNILYVSVAERVSNVLEACFTLHAYLHIAEYFHQTDDSTFVLHSFGTTFILNI